MDLKALIHNNYFQFGLLFVALIVFVLIIVRLSRSRQQEKRMNSIYIDDLKSKLENAQKEAKEASAKSYEALEEVKRLLKESKEESIPSKPDLEIVETGDSTDAFPWKIKPSILKNAVTYTKHFKLDKDNQSAVFEGTKGELYTTTLYA